MSLSRPVEHKGYALTDPKKWNDLKVTDFKPKTFEADDVEIAITHCGVCGSDVHTLTQGWGESKLPLIVGHEIIGTVTRVGDKVKDFKPGDRAGVGAQRGSCMSCRACKDGLENYCPKGIETYNAVYPDGVVAQGGYSTAIRAHQRFVFPIPDEIESRDAASMMCAGLTVFSPLKTHGCGPGKKVGIVGIGGLGHYAVLWAKAMGAEVYAFTHDDSKVDDIKKMGADHVVNTGKKDFAKDYSHTLDIIVSTRDSFGDKMPLGDFLSMLYVHGRFITVGLPDADDTLPPVHPFDFAPNGCLLGGSKIGSKEDCLEMLELARSKGIKPWIEEMPMCDVGKALQNVKDNKVRYRYVLTQDLA
ncbi:GroES-like protein [Lentinus tigrinus ALCF2SS1-6]|uniref:GroES-like protein n=1 Tax=Lentinus tigrinus ALCF2SS1-6 TaxID=1328759 RepID=A0A5C2RQU2_9APHY|nr:GroES-like protein [Lentinus tigrinus ALCF2SS1-6]